MIKVVCIKNRPANCPKTEKIGDILYLDSNTIFSDADGDWYGKMYVMDNDMDYIEQGTRLLSRFQRIE